MLDPHFKWIDHVTGTSRPAKCECKKKPEQQQQQQKKPQTSFFHNSRCNGNTEDRLKQDLINKLNLK